MQREIVICLSTTPYSFENTHTIFKIADAALKKGQKVRLIAQAMVFSPLLRARFPSHYQHWKTLLAGVSRLIYEQVVCISAVLLERMLWLVK